MRQLICVFVVVLSLALSVAIAWADHSHDYQLASDAYNAGDYKTAFHLWSEEAAKGAAEAREMLGAMYAAGKGVPQDYGQAVKWYRMAAEDGRVSAQYTLGSFYYSGQGVGQSNEYAYAWWLIAASNGSMLSKKKWDKVKNEMTPAEIEVAHRAVVEALLVLAE